MNCQRTAFVISLLLSTSLYPAATPPRSYDGASASAAAAPAAEVKRSAAEHDTKEQAGKPYTGATVLPGSHEWNDKVRATAMAERLYQAGTINSIDEQGCTPYQRALVAGDRELAGWLVQFGAISEWSYQGKTWQDLAQSSGLKDFHPTHGCGCNVPHFDREVWEYLEKTWIKENVPKPWLAKVMQDDDVEMLKKRFSAQKPVMRVVIPLLWHALRANSLKIIRHLLVQIESLSLLPQTKNHIVSRTLRALAPPRTTVEPLIREFMYRGYDMSIRAFPGNIHHHSPGWNQAISPLEVWSYCDERLWNPKMRADWLAVARLLVESGDDNISSMPQTFGKFPHKYKEQMQYIAHDGLRRRREQRLVPQLEQIRSVLLPIDGAFNVLAPVIHAYAGIPPLSIPAAAGE